MLLETEACSSRMHQFQLRLPRTASGYLTSSQQAESREVHLHHNLTESTPRHVKVSTPTSIRGNVCKLI